MLLQVSENKKITHKTHEKLAINIYQTWR